MKYNRLVLVMLIFFLVVNTKSFWEGYLGAWELFVSFLLLVAFLLLIGVVLRQLYLIVKDRFRDKKRLFVIALMILVLTLTVCYPRGIITINQFTDDDILVAQFEGAANCMTTYKLKTDYTFTKRTVCFGVEEVSGVYQLKGDTIFFNKPSGRSSSMDYAYGVIEEKNVSSSGIKTYLHLHRHVADSIGITFPIVKNHLTK